MATNAQVAAQVLRNCAEFFTSVSEQNPSIKEQMDANAQTCSAVAQLIEQDPNAESPLGEAPNEGGDSSSQAS